jgi:pimeloyl-ACP methyl ester carboxylesterase
MADWTDGYWRSPDGLRLHYRDYPGPADRPPVLCFPGLTRNARDFEDLAAALSGEWRVIAVDLRGRGCSEFAPDPMSYNPLTYLGDVETLLAELGISRFVAFGTSLGGLVAMLLAAIGPQRIAGALINDVGPEIEPVGLERIRAYVGRPLTWRGWSEAAAALGEASRDIYPDWEEEEWLRYARRLGRQQADGSVVLDYDMAIAEPLKLPAPEVDLWPAFRALAGSGPLLLVRGERSDLLSEATLARMREEAPEMDVVTVPRVGHAPTLDEPEARVGIARLLERVEGAAL